jgi:hypothetical protein
VRQSFAVGDVVAVGLGPDADRETSRVHFTFVSSRDAHDSEKDLQLMNLQMGVLEKFQKGETPVVKPKPVYDCPYCNR